MDPSSPIHTGTSTLKGKADPVTPKHTHTIQSPILVSPFQSLAQSSILSPPESCLPSHHMLIVTHLLFLFSPRPPPPPVPKNHCCHSHCFTSTQRPCVTGLAAKNCTLCLSVCVSTNVHIFYSIYYFAHCLQNSKLLPPLLLLPLQKKLSASRRDLYPG